MPIVNKVRVHISTINRYKQWIEAQNRKNGNYLTLLELGELWGFNTDNSAFTSYVANKIVEMKLASKFPFGKNKRNFHYVALDVPFEIEKSGRSKTKKYNGYTVQSKTLLRHKIWLNAIKKENKILNIVELAELWNVKGKSAAQAICLSLVKYGLAEKQLKINSKTKHFYIPLKEQND